MVKLLYAPVLLSLLLFSLGSCGLLDFLVPKAPSNNTSVNSAANATANTVPLENASARANVVSSQTDLSQKIIEQKCLNHERLFASQTGYEPGLIFRCTCTSTEVSGNKFYLCRVSASGSPHSLNVSCTSLSCKFSSERFGKDHSYRIDQLDRELPEVPVD